MEGDSARLDSHGGPDHGWWVELLRDGERVAYYEPRRVEVTRRDRAGDRGRRYRPGGAAWGNRNWLKLTRRPERARGSRRWSRWAASPSGPQSSR
jgi:hypothetical protein